MKKHGIAIVVSLFFALCGVMSGVAQLMAAEGPDKSKSDMSRSHGDDPKMPNGVIGVALNVGAERIGDPALLYVAHVHPEGPAQQAGLKHGDEIATVNGAAVTGKTYEQVVMMVRGEAGTPVKLGVKGESAVRELSITRVASETLYKDQKGEMKSHGSSSR
jgi:C-terminal processing protease CtpA/Prc